MVSTTSGGIFPKVDEAAGGSTADLPCQDAVRVAISTTDRLAAFRLRYRAYVIEQVRLLPEADHERQLLFDELDDEGDILIVEAGGNVRGTVRANLLSSPVTRTRYREILHLERFSNVAPAAMAVCSRFALAYEEDGEGTRHRRLAQMLLFRAMYAHGLLHDVRLCFACCSAALLPTLLLYGFREFAEPVRDLGQRSSLHRTLLVMDDIDYLKKIGSPLLSSNA